VNDGLRSQADTETTSYRLKNERNQLLGPNLGTMGYNIKELSTRR